MSEQRLIDANALLRLICDFNCDSCEHFSVDDGGCTDIAASFAKIVNGMQTIDPVRHGKWNYTQDLFRDTLCNCSVCGIRFVLFHGTTDNNLYDYCPNCGAKMDGDKNV